MSFYERHRGERDQFEIVAFHESSVGTFRELDQKLGPIITNVWKGKSLPFPILLDATGETLEKNYGIQAFPTTILIDPEGKLVRGSAEQLLERVLAAEKEPGAPIAVSPAGEWLAAVAGREVKVTSRVTDQIRITLSGSDAIRALAFAPDGQTLAAAESDHTIRLWDLTSGKSKAVLRRHDGAIFALAFAPDGRTLASAGSDTVRLWNTKSGRQISTLARYRFPAWSVAFAPDGNTLAAGGLGVVRLWDVASGKEKYQVRAARPAPVWSLAFAPTGSTLAVAEEDRISFWNPATGRQQSTVQREGTELIYLRFEDRDRTLLSISRGKTVNFWDANRPEGKGSVDRSMTERASAMAHALPDNAAAFHAEAVAVIWRTNRSDSEYAEALAKAKAAYQLEPGNTKYEGDFGLALYRTGKYDEAIPHLRAAAVVPAELGEDRVSLPPSLCFLAMAQARSGDREGAFVTVARAQGLIRNRGSYLNNFVTEMEAVVFGPGATKAGALLDGRFARDANGGGDKPTADTVIAGLKDDATIPSELRDTAIAMAPFIEANRLVATLHERLLLRARITNAIATATDVSPAARRLASVMAAELKENPDALNSASWQVVEKPGHDGAAYQLALEQAEAAVRLQPSPNHMNTLGVAQYRAGKYPEALQTLTRSRQVNPAGHDQPADVAFLAMTCHKLGQVAEAKAYLNQLRAHAKDFADDPDSTGFLREAEAMLGAVAASASPTTEPTGGQAR